MRWCLFCRLSPSTEACEGLGSIVGMFTDGEVNSRSEEVKTQ